jgi:hypothetical protein
MQKVDGRVLLVWQYSCRMETLALPSALESMHFPENCQLHADLTRFRLNDMLTRNEDGRQACAASLAIQPPHGNVGPRPGLGRHAFPQTAIF